MALPLEVIQQLPKAELHCHLDGSVRVATIIELAKEQNVDLPSFEATELIKTIEAPANCPSLVEYLRGFAVTLSVMQRAYALTRCMYEVAEDAVADGVRYLEVRFSPILHTEKGLTVSEVMDAVCEGVTMAEYRLPITVRIIVCGMRHLDPAINTMLAEFAWRYLHRGVVAFDLAGPEYGYSSTEHKEAFDIVRSRCLNCTLHSGEAAPWQYIQDAIRECGAQRIGHGVQLVGSAELQKYVVDRRIPVEVCLTSNVQTQAVKTLDDHPVRKFFDAGVIVVPCTDNKTVSGVTLSSEYLILHKKFGFTVPELVRLLDNGFASAFIDFATRTRLRVEALTMACRVLSPYGLDAATLQKSFLEHTLISGMNWKPSKTYWKGHDNPDFTMDILRKLPKTDLHCRLDGGVSIDTMWTEVETILSFDKENTKRKKLVQLFSDRRGSKGLQANEAVPPTRDRLVALMHGGDATREQAKALSRFLLQTPGQIVRGLEDMFQVAKEDNVRYVEVCVRVKAHTEEGMSDATVVETVLAANERLQKETGVHAGVMLAASSASDDPIAFRAVAELAVKNTSKGVVGFGVFGDSEINAEAYKYYASTFHYLKANNVQIVMSAGICDPSTVLLAVNEGGAVRISGGFQIHKEPSIAQLVADRRIPVEMNVTDKLDVYTKDMDYFCPSPIRMYLDQCVPVTACSFRRATYATSRAELLLRIVEDANLSAADLLKLLGHGFMYNFSSFSLRERLFAEFREESTSYLRSLGFDFFEKQAFLPLDLD